MHKMTRIAVGILSLLMLSSCEAQPQYELFNVLLGKDHRGPVLLKSEAIGDKTAVYHFDEMVFCSSQDFATEKSNNDIVSVNPYGKTVSIEFSRSLEPGKRVRVRGKVADHVGNTLTFAAGVWGHNGRVPELLINEFSTKGTESNPDRIELLALTKGNLAGVAVYLGMADDFDSEFVFPSIEIGAGQRIVLVYNQTVDEKIPLTFETGEVGIGGNNGVISLYTSPDGEIIDAVLYSNRSSDSDENFGGFGTAKVHRWATLLEESGAWIPHPTIPETAIDSTDSTATRSFCRTEGNADSDRKHDWHIVPTRGATFGEENLKEHYSQ